MTTNLHDVPDLDRHPVVRKGPLACANVTTNRTVDGLNGHFRRSGFHGRAA